MVPFNTAVLKKREVGLDAFFWNYLEKKYRVVLLVQPASELVEEAPPGSCRLTAEVSIEAQLRDISYTASLEPQPPRLKKKISFGRRILEMLLPGAAMSRLKPGEIVEVSEQEQARLLAKMLVKLSPLEKVMWASFEVDSESGLLLPLSRTMRKIYSKLAELDPGYREASSRAISYCRRWFWR
jgi:hypothetical protein